MPRKTTVSGRCKKCGVWRYSLHKDHIVPKYKGGTDDPSNIQYICANCHEDKTREDLKGHKFNVGKVRTPEQRARLRAAMSGRVISQETRRLMSAAAKRGWARFKGATHPSVQAPRKGKPKPPGFGREGWATRRVKYGPSGVSNPTLASSRVSKATKAAWAAGKFPRKRA